MASQAKLEDADLIEMDTPLQLNGAIRPSTSIIAALSYKDPSSAGHAKLEDTDLLDMDNSTPFNSTRGPPAELERTSNFRPGGKAEAMLISKRNSTYLYPTPEPTPQKAELMRVLARAGRTTGLRDRTFMTGNSCRSQYDEDVEMDDGETPEEDDGNGEGDEDENTGEDEEDEGEEDEKKNEPQEDEDEHEDDDEEEQEESSTPGIPVMYAAPANERVDKRCPPKLKGASVLTSTEDRRGPSYRRTVMHESGSKAPSSARGLKGTYPTAHVKAHPDKNFWHGGRGWWHPGLPAEGAHPTTGVRGPDAAAWKARNTAQGRKKAAS
ncbi:Hypothetical predicted protein [Lecanosticta acicola]|uniref:Uncharacterized protein n=1 Tax=Lecanosticta acicola TaxID=111012 RepID=A0AAI8YPF9_9PEZI|nr:Hypothetical predicted protein [Lecanosticta acicola]